MSFGARVSLLRKQTPRLSQRELDSLAGLHPGHTWQIEEGHRENPTRQTVAGLSEVFCVSVDWLMLGRGDPPARLDLIAAVNSARMRRETSDGASNETKTRRASLGSVRGTDEGQQKIKELAEGGAFASIGRGGEECMLYVAWSGLKDPGDNGQGHVRRRGEVTVDLGLDAVPTPPFTDAEMQAIAFGAKIAALKALRRRKRAAGSKRGVDAP